MTSPDFPADIVVAAIIVAAGSGTRFGAASNKVLVELAGQPLWQRSLAACSTSSLVHHRVVVIRREIERSLRP